MPNTESKKFLALNESEQQDLFEAICEEVIMRRIGKPDHEETIFARSVIRDYKEVWSELSTPPPRISAYSNTIAENSRVQTSNMSDPTARIALLLIQIRENRELLYKQYKDLIEIVERCVKAASYAASDQKALEYDLKQYMIDAHTRSSETTYHTNKTTLYKKGIPILHKLIASTIKRNDPRLTINMDPEEKKRIFRCVNYKDILSGF